MKDKNYHFFDKCWIFKVNFWLVLLLAALAGVIVWAWPLIIEIDFNDLNR